MLSYYKIPRALHRRESNDVTIKFLLVSLREFNNLIFLGWSNAQIPDDLAEANNSKYAEDDCRSEENSVE